MSLTVVSIAYPLVPVGPDTVGGTEQVLLMLDEALERNGHRSIVIAPEGSQVSGMLVPTPARGGHAPIDDATWNEAYAIHRRALKLVLEALSADVVHMHGVDFHSYLPDREDVPVLATLHLPPHNYPADVSRPDRTLTFLSCVSEFSRRLYPPDAPITVIPNGVRLDRFRPVLDKGDFVLALGRVCPEKGFHLALDAARKAGLSLLIGGSVSPWPEHHRYFEEEIRPRLDEKRRFLGPLPMPLRVDLLARARCVIMPSLVNESGPLVALEALASGTPVVARPVGALPEYLDHGVTGILADDVDSLARALHDAAALDPRACRRAAVERFSAERVARSYIDLYTRIAALGHAEVQWQPPAWERYYADPAVIH
jgi:glycosyltransferase involved in cell wall biosynthesis